MCAGTRKLIVVGLGEILWDRLPGGKQLGGAPANFAYHAFMLGANSYVASCVGSDELGREITERLASLKLDQRYIAFDRTHPTGTVDVELDANGKPNFIIQEDVAWDFIPTTPALLDLARRTDAVCFGSLCQRSSVSRNTIRRFLRATRADCLRVFDINLRQRCYSRQIVEDSLKLSKVLKLNDDELPVVAALLGLKGSETSVLEQLTARYGLCLVALTKGEKGSILYTPERSSTHPGFRVEVVDSVGAGDAFTAALVMGLLRGDELDRIHAFANRLAAYVCSQRGATPEIPTELIREG